MKEHPNLSAILYPQRQACCHVLCAITRADELTARGSFVVRQALALARWVS